MGNNHEPLWRDGCECVRAAGGASAGRGGGFEYGQCRDDADTGWRAVSAASCGVRGGGWRELSGVVGEPDEWRDRQFWEWVQERFCKWFQRGWLWRGFE